uniref:Plasmid stabilization protein n=1 Tax=Heterorhabditis bacteriophora TaxID=37862 RepID=A0A1I7XQK5_HETBA
MNLHKVTLSTGEQLPPECGRAVRHAASANASSRAKNAYSNASALLADLLSDYDIRLRPGFGVNPI